MEIKNKEIKMEKKMEIKNKEIKMEKKIRRKGDKKKKEIEKKKKRKKKEGKIGWILKTRSFFRSFENPPQCDARKNFFKASDFKTLKQTSVSKMHIHSHL